MKRIFLLLLIATLIALGLGNWLQNDPGYVLAEIAGWRIESNMLVLLLATVFAAFVAYCLISVIKLFLRGSSSVLSRFTGGKEAKARKRTNAGLLAYLEGNWREAARLLKRSAIYSDTPLVNFLAAARAQHEQGNYKEAEQLLQQAYEQSKDAEFPIGIAKAQMELDQNQLESALATLIRLKAIQPHHPFVIKLLRNVYMRLEDWKQLIQLLPELRKQEYVDQAHLDTLEEEAWSKVFSQQAEELERNNDKDQAPQSLAELWKQLPESIRYDEEIIAAYADQLMRLGHSSEAETLLRKMLNKHWSALLINRYGQVEGRDLQEQLLAAENWLRERTNDAALLLALGRISLRNQLWGKAHEYFLASNQLNHSKESYAELCRIEKFLDSPQGSAHLDGLIQSLALPDLPMPTKD